MSAKGSVLKRVRQSRKSNLKNRSYKSAIKTAMKKAISNSDNKEVSETYKKEAVSVIDKASNKGIIHKNKAARYKSRIMKNK
tara:strand:- start:165 stop:410 length:246 start_codon:yes stop_codon:yes gene_type:complete